MTQAAMRSAISPASCRSLRCARGCTAPQKDHQRRLAAALRAQECTGLTEALGPGGGTFLRMRDLTASLSAPCVLDVKVRSACFRCLGAWPSRRRPAQAPGLDIRCFSHRRSLGSRPRIPASERPTRRSARGRTPGRRLRRSGFGWAGCRRGAPPILRFAQQDVWLERGRGWSAISWCAGVRARQHVRAPRERGRDSVVGARDDERRRGCREGGRDVPVPGAAGLV